MPKKASGEFNQAEYLADWSKKNMKRIGAQYKREFVDEFQEACKALGIAQSQVFREAMGATIKKHNDSK